jgi:drug/metabolite transporter (DMT)-like permease
MTTKRQKNIAIMEMLLCAALWSTAGIFIKKIEWNPFVIAGVRSIFSGLVTFVYMKAARMSFVLNRRSVFSGAVLCMTFACFVTANKLTTAANAIVLQFTNPMFILIFSAIFLKEKFFKSDLLAVGFTMAGISLFFFDQLTAGHLLGNVVAIVSGMFFAAFYVGIGDSKEGSG